MTNEEMQRAMEFMIRQQAKYAARLEKDESRLAGLEESFKMLVKLKNKPRFAPNLSAQNKPPRQVISDAEFRRRLKERTLEWSKKRLAELRSKNSR